MPRGQIGESGRKALEEAQARRAGEMAQAYERRIIVDDWCVFWLDELNWVLQKETGERESRDRAYFATFGGALLALFDCVTGKRTKRDLASVTDAMEQTRQEILAAVARYE